MSAIAIDASLEKQVTDEYCSWKRAQGYSIVSLPARGGPDAKNIITLYGIERPFHALLIKLGIPFEVV